MAARRLSWLSASAVVLVLDWATKRWAVGALKGEAPVELLPVLRLVYAENTGIAFGFFAGGGDIGRWLLVSAAVIIIATLLVMLWRAASAAEAFACALIVGGAAGNLADRLRFGYVVDFIDAHWRAHHWPAFNVADAAISIGAMLIIALLLKPPADEEN